MSDQSDGEKPVYVKKLVLDKIYPKTRCLSLGSLNVDKHDINKTIGLENIKNGSDIKTYLDKTSGQKKINSGTTSVQDVSKRTINDGPVELFANIEDVFKPKRKVGRTPPKFETYKIQDTTKDQISREPNTHKEPIGNLNSVSSELKNPKRPRSELSPEYTEREKIRRENESEEKQLDNMTNSYENSKTKVEIEQQPTTELLEVALNSLEIIHECSDMAGTTEENKKMMREAIFALHRVVTKLSYRIGQVEKQDLELPQKKTYASVIKKSESLAIRNVVTNRPWTTPPNTIRKLETIVRKTDNTDPTMTIQEIKQSVKNKDVDGGFKNVIPLKNGAVIVQSHNKRQQDKLKQALGNKQDITIKELGKTDPMFMLTGIDKGYNNDEFIEELLRQNHDINILLTEKSSIKVITKKACRNPMKENWILQAPPKIAKWFLKEEKINFDLVTVYVQEYLPITMCFKCCGFGHVAKYCKKKESCHKCSGEHPGKDCQENNLKCPNCTQMGYADTSHSARSTYCQAYQKKWQRTRLNVNYSDSENF